MAEDFTDVLAVQNRMTTGAALGTPVQDFTDVLRAQQAMQSAAIPEVQIPDGPAQVMESDRGKIFSGGTVRDIFDALSAMQYAAAGAAHGIATGQNPLSAAWEGIKNRASWEDVLGDVGIAPSWGRTALGLVGDIALDPAWIITPSKVFNVLSKIDAFDAGVKAVGRGISESKIGSRVLEQIVPNFRLPAEVKDYFGTYLERLSARKDQILQVFKGSRELGDGAAEFIHGFLSAPDKAAQEAIVEAAKVAGFDGSKIRELGTLSSEIDKSVLKDLFAEKVIGKKAYAEINYLNPYKNYSSVADVEAHIKELATRGDPIGKIRATQLNEWLIRKGPDIGGTSAAEVEAALKDSLGNISDVGYTTARSMMQGSSMAAEAEFMNKLVPYMEKLPSKEGMIKLPGIARYGALGGKYLPREIGLFVLQKFHNPTAWERAIAVPYNYWKMFKVTANPAAQMRNLFANLGLINIAGVPAVRLPDLYTKAWSLLRGGGSVFGDPAKDAEALKLAEGLKGAMEGTFVGQEMARNLDIVETSGANFFQKMRNVVKVGLDKAQNLYKNNEVWGKTAAGLYAIEHGMDAEKAIAFGEKALFNYAETPILIDKLRRNGIVPFASFGYFATQAAARAAWAAPAALTKYAKAMTAIEARNPQAQKERQFASEWQNQFGRIFTPLQDKYGRHLVFDATYLLPFQDITDAAEGGILQKLQGLTPFPTLLADLARNESAFTGRKITEVGLDRAFDPNSPSAFKEKAVKDYIDYIYKFAMPSWMPSILPGFPDRMKVSTGGYAFRNLADAITARPDVFGRFNGKPVQDWKNAVMGEVFGLKTRPFDLSNEQRFRSYEYKDNVEAVTRQMRKISMDQELTVEQKTRLIDQLKNDLVNIHRGWRMTP